MAEQLGATCLTEINSSVAHLVAADCITKKSQWAVNKKQFLIYPQWIEAALFIFIWQKLPEENFLVGK